MTWSFWQTLTSVSRLPVRLARRVWTRLTATNACVHLGEPEQGVRKVNAHRLTAGPVHQPVIPLSFWIAVVTWLVSVSVNRPPCMDGGRIVADGARWDKDCNTCYCHNSRVTCTKVRDALKKQPRAGQQARSVQCMMVDSLIWLPQTNKKKIKLNWLNPSDFNLLILIYSSLKNRKSWIITTCSQ